MSAPGSRLLPEAGSSTKTKRDHVYAPCAVSASPVVPRPRRDARSFRRTTEPPASTPVCRVRVALTKPGTVKVKNGVTTGTFTARISRQSSMS